MRGEAWRASLCIWLPRGVRRDHGHGNMRLKAGNALSPEVCAVTMFPSAVDFYSHANSLLFDMLSDRQSSTFWASGSVMAGAEARGTRLVPSGCSVAGLARRTCDTRARPRGRARVSHVLRAKPATEQPEGTRRVPRASAPAITLPEAQKVLLWRSESMSKSSEFACE